MIRINKELVEYVTRLSCLENNHNVIEQRLSPKQVVLEQRKNVYSVYIIKSGIAKCYMTEDTGIDFIQEFFGEGEIFGEIEMFNNDLSFCSIQAITDLEVFKIPRDNFHALLTKDNKFNELILKSLASKIKYTAVRHSYNQSHTIELNLMRLKKQFPDLTQTISKKDIANYLGITERSLNRVFSSLKNETM